MKMTNPLMQNSLTGVQSAQQAPVGIPPALAAYFATQQQAQQQAAAQPQAPTDQSQLADYIRQLQDSGASNEQIQNMVGQVQSTGQLPDQAQPDTLQGGDGGDQIANSTGNDTISGADSNSTIPQTSPNVSGASQPQQSPLSQALNQMASGQPNINYDQVGASYPKAQPLLQTSPLDSFSRAALKNSNAGNAASVFQAVQAGRQDQMNQQNAAIAQQNQQALGAYGSQVGIAEKAGNIQSNRAKTDQMADYRENQLDMAQSKLDEAIKNNASKEDIAQQRADIAQQRADIAASGGSKNKPLSADIQKQISLGLDQFLGTRDSKGNTLDPTKDIDPTQKNQILASAASYLQQNPNVGAQGAIGHVINDQLGGIKGIQDAKSPLFGTNTPRMFPDAAMQKITPQSAPDVSGAPAAASVPNVTPQTAPTVTGTPSAATAITGAQGGGSAVDNLVQQYLQANPNATAAQAAKARMLAIQKVNGQ